MFDKFRRKREPLNVLSDLTGGDCGQIVFGSYPLHLQDDTPRPVQQVILTLARGNHTSFTITITPRQVAAEVPFTTGCDKIDSRVQGPIEKIEAQVELNHEFLRALDRSNGTVLILNEIVVRVYSTRDGEPYRNDVALKRLVIVAPACTVTATA